MKIHLSQAVSPFKIHLGIDHQTSIILICLNHIYWPFKIWFGIFKVIHLFLYKFCDEFPSFRIGSLFLIILFEFFIKLHYFLQNLEYLSIFYPSKIMLLCLLCLWPASCFLVLSTLMRLNFSFVYGLILFDDYLTDYLFRFFSFSNFLNFLRHNLQELSFYRQICEINEVF